MDKLIAPQDWKNNLQWFDGVDRAVREKFAKERCSKVYSWEGQAAVIISYPRQNGRVAFYDMDAGAIKWMHLDDCKVGEGLEKVLRNAEEADFEWNAIEDSILCDEAADIAGMLFD